MQCASVVLYVKSGLCEVTGEKKTDIHERMATPTSKKRKYEEVCWSLSRSIDINCGLVLAARKIGYAWERLP